jgi:hypothetical protein
MAGLPEKEKTESEPRCQGPVPASPDHHALLEGIDWMDFPVRLGYLSCIDTGTAIYLPMNAYRNHVGI